MPEAYVAFNIQISQELSDVIEAVMRNTGIKKAALGRALLWEALHARKDGTKGEKR
ncbi:hypothetical protein LCGC14_1333090 [marine sediment metagenome]|uniref:Ribbon-helix-helix protein CopG domain-containing protein n=1 Tax=marine sediment metagenome TaxID=412755 RepID=A0A0F9KFU8_9ZZZZ